MPKTPVKLAPLNTTGLVLVHEPLEAAFSMLMPAGWTNLANLQRESALNRILASSTSPDGRTAIHFNDPRLPYFVVPNGYIEYQMMNSPHMVVQPYVPAEPFFRDYIGQCFARAPQFQLLSVADNPDLAQIIMADSLKGSHRAHATSVIITFQYQPAEEVVQSRIHGSTITNGTNWFAEFYAVTSPDDLSAPCEMARRMYLSRVFDPAWAALQQRRHEQSMAIGQQQLDHINAMTNLQAQGHAQRMHDIAQAGQINTQIHNDRLAQSDAQMEGWRARQAESDQAHQAWMARQVKDDEMQQARVNAIRGEHTVVDGSGNTYQVEAHHERYYLNTRDNTYIGVSSTTELADLRKKFGVNPDDYQEVKVIR
jgi:hypothetical protein